MTFITQWLRLQRSQWIDERRLERLQIRALRRVVQHGYSTVPFYRKLYKASDFDPADLRSLDDLRRIPMVSKEQLRTSPTQERLSGEFSADACFVRRTSGSTGQPVEILEEPEAVDVIRAYQLRRLLAYGYRPWERIVVLDPRKVDKPVRGQAFSNPLARLLLGRNLVNVPMRTPQEQLATLQSMRPKWLWALPSALRSIGDLVKSGKSLGFDIRGILTWGELLDRRTRETIETSLQAPIFDGYGAVEVGPLGGLAWECGSHGFHVNADCVILEFLRDGERVSPGERGEVVATSLYRFAMPAIRYKLYDYAVPSDESCECGRGLPLLKALEGRKVDCLVAENGELVSPFRVIVALEQMEQIARYQIIQQNRDRLEVSVEAPFGLSSVAVDELVGICKSLLGQNMQINVNSSGTIVHEPGRKFQPVICKVQKTL